jgi:hypothetical protein
MNNARRTSAMRSVAGDGKARSGLSGAVGGIQRKEWGNRRLTENPMFFLKKTTDFYEKNAYREHGD